VNLSSLFGLLSVPGNGTYNATKFAVRGFTEALRQELEVTGAPVSATCVHPGGIKTNIARSARLDGSMKDLGIHDPVAATRAFERMFRVTAEEAAETILRGVERNARRVLIGRDALALDALQRLLPSAYQRIVVAGTRRTIKRIDAKSKARA
jgi:short-subunit dehydrogenase